MSSTTEPSPLSQSIKISNYEIHNTDDEIRVDQLCVSLIRHIFQTFIQEDKMPPNQTGELCHGADYFLREFIIGDQHENILTIDPQRVKQFAGHWYIIRHMEPNLSELKNILTGTKAFYTFLATKGLVDHDVATKIASHCAAHEYYQQRIEDFWAIKDDGYNAWRQACPLKPAEQL